MTRSKLYFGLIVGSLALIMTACFGSKQSKTESDDPVAKALIGNRTRIIQTTSDIDTALSYMCDPVEFELVMTMDGKPLCQALGGDPELCQDNVSAPVSHQEIKETWYPSVAFEHGFQESDFAYACGPRVVTVSGNSGQTTQAFSVSNFRFVPDVPKSDSFTVNGVYETFWTHVSGDWKLYRMRITMNFTIQ